MSDQIKSSVVRIRSLDGKVVGAGFLVDKRHIITCAHVIDGALGREFNTLEQPTAPVCLDFYVEPDVVLQAHVTVWHPRQPDKNGDIAGLELVHGTRLPLQTHPAKLLRIKTTTNLWGHPFRAFGFPKKREFGVWATEGVIRASTTSGWLQIETTQSSGYHVQPGFSGGPVWDSTLKAVVGMVVVADEKPRTAFIIPTELLAETWPQLTPKLIDPLADYRISLLGKTKYVNLSGIPPLDRSGGEIEPKIPLDKVYIRIQAIERKQQHDREKAEKAYLELEAQRRIQDQANTWRDREIGTGTQDWVQRNYVFRRDSIATLRTLGEYFYRRGEVYQASKRPNPIDPQEALKEHKRLVILGAPGSGKSTMLRYLARRVAEDDNGPIPILVSLGKYAAELSQLDKDSIPSLNEFALKQASGDDETLYQLLTDAVERQEVLWLLDALDETQSYKQAESVATEISRLLGLGQLILTSRPVGYITADSLKDLSHFEVLPLATEDVVGFLFDWFSILAENRDDIPSNWVEEQVTNLRMKLEERPNLQPLMHNPLLLTFMVILAEEDPTQQLPTHRADLYHYFISKLLDRWERTRPAIFAFEALGGDREEARYAVLDGFQYLGWRMHLIYFSNQQSSVPNRDTLMKDLEDYWGDQYPNAWNLANDVIDFWMTAGLFEVWHLKSPQTRKSEEFLTFRHLTFQEYAVAEYLLKEWGQTPEETWQFVNTQFHHYAWREVILLMAGRMDIGLVNDLVRRFYFSSQPFSHLTNNLSWFDWMAAMLPDLLFGRLGLSC